jgi:hypothetical protein
LDTSRGPRLAQVPPMDRLRRPDAAGTPTKTGMVAETLPGPAHPSIRQSQSSTDTSNRSTTLSTWPDYKATITKFFYILPFFTNPIPNFDFFEK